MGDNLPIHIWRGPSACDCDRCIEIDASYMGADCEGEAAAVPFEILPLPIRGGERGVLYLGRRGNLTPGGIRPAGELIPGNLGGGRYGDADIWADHPLIARGIPDSYGGSDE